MEWIYYTSHLPEYSSKFHQSLADTRMHKIDRLKYKLKLLLDNFAIFETK